MAECEIDRLPGAKAVFTLQRASSGGNMRPGLALLGGLALGLMAASAEAAVMSYNIGFNAACQWTSSLTM